MTHRQFIYAPNSVSLDPAAAHCAIFRQGVGQRELRANGEKEYIQLPGRGDTQCQITLSRRTLTLS
jgi:hypothetical protein